MHLVRSTNGATFIDEQHLVCSSNLAFASRPLRAIQSVQSLCSGFSYCLSILQMFYVWNGRGAKPEERKAAFDYATSLCGDADSVTVLDEGENDEDEMFWAVLGDGDKEYANAFHWAWRAGANAGDPQLWNISASPSQWVGSIHRVTRTRLMHPSSRISPLRPTRRSTTAYSFWTPYGRYLFSLAPRLGVNGRTFG